MSPWEILGLPEGETDPLALRRAYAAALRAHRPDSDPEGFRRVRDAYEALLSGTVVAKEETPSTPSPETASSGQPSPVPEDAPPSLPDACPPELVAERDELVRRLEDAVASARAGGSDADLVQAVKAMTQEAQRTPGTLLAFSHALAAVLPVAKHPVLDRFVPPTQWVQAVGIGDAMLADAVLERWVDSEDWDRVAEAAREAVKQAVGLPHAGSATVVLRLCLAAAIADPAAAKALVDYLYATVPVGARQSIDLASLDAFLLIGKEVAAWPLAARNRLAATLHRPAWEPADAKKSGASALRRALARAHPESMPAIAVARDYPALAAWSRLSSKARLAPSTRWRPDPWKVLATLAILVMFVARLQFPSDPKTTRGVLPDERVRVVKPLAKPKLTEIERFRRWRQQRVGESVDDWRRRLLEAGDRRRKGESIGDIVGDDPAPPTLMPPDGSR